MTATVTLHDKSFRLYQPAAAIAAAVGAVAARLNTDYAQRQPLLVAVLNGSFMFAADLVRQLTLNGVEISFVKLVSYEGTESTGTVKQLIGLREDIAGRHVIVVEDIVDTGHTAAGLVRTLHEQGAASVEIACLLLKPASVRVPLAVRYAGLEIPNDFVVGYGLDYDGHGRHLPDLYQAIA
ncbi:MAG: hypoxanthine phosphoribosyltransferase [Hymenobacteraceae bacterium]|nr:hypoxanthine phosphoribosyltransferase [Hymenobacteraceae bacterium]